MQSLRPGHPTDFFLRLSAGEKFAGVRELHDRCVHSVTLPERSWDGMTGAGVVFTAVCHGVSLEPFRLASDGFGLVNLFGVIESDPFGVEILTFFSSLVNAWAAETRLGTDEPRFRCRSSCSFSKCMTDCQGRHI